jgi:mRNA-degrading endonuclease RelE of RelBE toxin-antitoxin system
MPITIKKTGLKALKKMQPSAAARIESAIEKFAKNPAANPANVKPLTHVENGFRIRVGDWRVSLTLDPENGNVDVFEIAPRGGAYKW